MNERIRELAEQCTYHYESSNGSGEYETFDKEKFAELVMEECIGIMNNISNEDLTAIKVPFENSDFLYETDYKEHIRIRKSAIQTLGMTAIRIREELGFIK